MRTFHFPGSNWQFTADRIRIIELIFALFKIADGRCDWLVLILAIFRLGEISESR